MTIARTSPSGSLVTSDNVANSSSRPGATVTDALNALELGTWHVEDFGAVALRTANTTAWNAAIAFIVAAGGGTLLAGPGIYLTNGPVGLDLAVDLNLNLTIQALGEFTLLRSNLLTAPTLQFHTTGGNLRELVINDLVIRGGREGLSLTWIAYSSFNRVWFWGSKQWACQNEAGNNNVFFACRWNESAQGVGDGTEADACLFVSCEDTIIAAQFGEFSGGLLINGGVVNVDDPLFHDCEYRGQNYFSYIDQVPVVISPTFLPITASIILWQGSAILSGINGNYLKRFLTAFRAYDVVISGRFQTLSTPATFVGFIDVETQGGTVLALNIQTATFVWLGTNSGYFIKDTDNVLHDAVIQAQLELYAGSVITPLSSSAPALLNPAFQNNLVTLRTFYRFTPRDVAGVTAWLQLTLGTITGSGYSSVPDEVVNNPAVQSVDARRPVNGLSADGFPIATFSDGSSSSLSWPLNAGNNQTSKTGFACWVKQPASSGPDRIISIGGGTGGASGQKLFLAFDTSQRVTVGLYTSDAAGRQGITAAAAFPADTFIFVRLAFDGTLGTEAQRCKIYINEVLQTLTFSDIGAGGAVTVLQTVTGNALLGNFNNSGTSLQGLNGSIGANFYCIAGDLSAADGAALMAYQPPVAA